VKYKLIWLERLLNMLSVVN